jgi:hypothetical protein
MHSWCWVHQKVLLHGNIPPSSSGPFTIAYLLWYDNDTLFSMKFFSQCVYRVGKLGELSAAEIEHALLRAPMSKPSAFGILTLLISFSSSLWPIDKEWFLAIIRFIISTEVW